MTAKQPTDQLRGVSWTEVSGVLPVIFVLRVEGRPMGIVEMLPTQSFVATTCRGVAVGEFASLTESQRALENAIGA